TLVVNDDTGSIAITLDYLPWGDTDQLSIYRVHPDGSRYPVRGYAGDWIKQPLPALPAIIEDYECPLGLRVWYLFHWTHSIVADSAQIYTAPVTGPTLTDGGQVWLKSPGLPALNTRVTMAEPPGWSRAARAGVYDI